MTYKISLDAPAKLITALVCVFIAIISITSFDIISKNGVYQSYYPKLVLLFIFLLTICFKPINYKIEEDYIIVKRILWDAKISRSEIHKAEMIDRAETSWSLRTFGSGGFFGYFGTFTNRKLGAMTWYLTRKDSLVLLKMKTGKKFLLSPDDREGFLAGINA